MLAGRLCGGGDGYVGGAGGAVADVVGCHDLHGVEAGGKAAYGVGSGGVAGDEYGASGATHGVCGREPANGVAGRGWSRRGFPRCSWSRGLRRLVRVTLFQVTVGWNRCRLVWALL